MPLGPEELLRMLLTEMYRTAVGANWRPQHQHDVDALVDAIVMVAGKAAETRVREHAEDAPHLYPDGSAG